MPDAIHDEQWVQARYALLEKAFAATDKLNKIVSELPLVVFETDAAGNWKFLNPAWQDLTGFDTADCIGQSFLQYVYEEDRERNNRLFRPLIEREKEYCRHQVRYIHSTNGFVWVEVQARLSFDESGNISGTIGTLSNIHQQKTLADKLAAHDRLDNALHLAERTLFAGDSNPPDEAALLWPILQAADIDSAVIAEFGTGASGPVFTSTCRLDCIDGEIKQQWLSQDQLFSFAPGLRRSRIIIGQHTESDEQVDSWTEAAGMHCTALIMSAQAGARKLLLLFRPAPLSQHELQSFAGFIRTFGLYLENQQARNRLEESERRLNLAIQATNEGVWDWNIKTNAVYMSPRWSRILGYEPGELAPVLDTWKSLVDPGDLVCVMEVLENHLRGATAQYDTTYRMRHKNGSWRWIHSRGKVVESDAGGTPLRLVGTHLDVTERMLMQEKLDERTRQLDEALRQMDTVMLISPIGFVLFDQQGITSYVNPGLHELLEIDEDIVGLDLPSLEAVLIKHNRVLINGELDSACGLVVQNPKTGSVIKIRLVADEPLPAAQAPSLIAAIDISEEYELSMAKSYFMSAASHELRTPLASVCGFSELLLESPEDFSEEERHEMLSIIHKQGKSLALIVSQLLDVARIESGSNMQVELDEADLTTCIRRNVANFIETEAEQQIVLELVDCCPATINEELLARLLNNLLSNACKYSPLDSKVTIRNGTQHIDGHVRAFIEVTDQGIGMSEQEQANAFERFYRADRSGRVTGLGLGLYIVRELVESMHGTISLQSSPGAGTTIRVSFPAGKQHHPGKE